MNQLPASFLRRMKEQLGNEFPDFVHSFDNVPLRGIRFHPLKSTSDLLLKDRVAKIPWAETGWILRNDSEAGTTVLHEAGAFYLQEPSAMIPAEVLDAKPGEKIIDLCAAPGGKSTQIGCAMLGQGLLICNEPVPKRAQILSRNVERMGIPNVIVISSYPSQLADRWTGGFDGVMVDAPCSGEGMFHRHPETISEWAEEKAHGCSQRQSEILSSAARLVRPGGRIVYSTCTWNPEENEDQILQFLNSHPDFKLESFHLPGIDGSGGMFICWPHKNVGEGQFVAKLRRDGNSAASLPLANIFPMSKDEIKNWNRIGDGLPFPSGRLGSMFFFLQEIPDLSGIKVFRIGLHLGEIRGKIPVPDHAAALSFIPPVFPYTDLSGEESIRYMAGESIEKDVSGWVLMRYHGLILGWGKGSEGRIRNHYPKGLRNSRLKIAEDLSDDS